MTTADDFTLVPVFFCRSCDRNGGVSDHRIMRRPRCAANAKSTVRDPAAIPAETLRRAIGGARKSFNQLDIPEPVESREHEIDWSEMV